MTELEEPLLTVLLNRAFLPEHQRDAKKADDAAERFKTPLKVLEGQLTGGVPRRQGVHRERPERRFGALVGAARWARPRQRPEESGLARTLYRAPGLRAAHHQDGLSAGLVSPHLSGVRPRHPP